MNDYGVLIHYASPYYDPVKAHEYYEQHKHLKGRKGSSKPSTSMLNEKGKQAAKYVKEQIQNERKSRVEASKNTRDTNIKNRSDSVKNSLNSWKDRINNTVKGLREELKNLPKEEKAARRDEYNQQISDIRQTLTDFRAMMRERLNAEKQGFRDTHKANVNKYKEEATSKYENELAKMVEDPEFKKTKKSSKSSKSTSLVFDEKTNKYL